MAILSAISTKLLDPNILKNRLHKFQIIEGESANDYILSVNNLPNGGIAKKVKNKTLERVKTISFNNSEFHILGYNEYTESVKEGIKGFINVDKFLDNIKSADGEYLLIGIEQSGQIHIISDRYSSRPCFYLIGQDGIYVSSNISFLISLTDRRLKFNATGLLEVLNFDHTLSGKTTFQQINRIRPAQQIYLKDGQVKSMETYWQPKFSSNPNRNFNEFSEKAYSRFKKSVEKRTKNRTGFVSLSGGLDSRLVASAADRDRFNAFTFINSIEDKETKDVKISKEVAKRLGYNHTIRQVSSSEEPVTSQINTLLRLTGGQSLIYHSIKVNTYIEEMKRTGFHLGGGPGDIIAGSHSYSAEELNSEKLEWVKRLKLRYPYPFVQKYFKNHESIYQSIKVSLDNSFSNINESSIAKTATIWAMNERYSAFTFNSPIHNDPDVAESSPHLGYSFVELMLTMNTQELHKKNFYKFLIYNCIPELRNVVYANTGRLLDSELIYLGFGYNKYLKSIADFTQKAKIFGYTKLMNYGIIKRDDFQYEMFRQDKAILETTKTILSSSESLDNILNINNCISFITDFEKGNIIISKSKDANFVSFLCTVTHISKMYNLG